MPRCTSVAGEHLLLQAAISAENVDGLLVVPEAGEGRWGWSPDVDLDAEGAQLDGGLDQPFGGFSDNDMPFLGLPTQHGRAQAEVLLRVRRDLVHLDELQDLPANGLLLQPRT